MINKYWKNGGDVLNLSGRRPARAGAFSLGHCDVDRCKYRVVENNVVLDRAVEWLSDQEQVK